MLISGSIPNSAPYKVFIYLLIFSLYFLCSLVCGTSNLHVLICSGFLFSSLLYLLKKALDFFFFLWIGLLILYCKLGILDGLLKLGSYVKLPH